MTAAALAFATMPLAGPSSRSRPRGRASCSTVGVRRRSPCLVVAVLGTGLDGGLLPQLASATSRARRSSPTCSPTAGSCRPGRPSSTATMPADLLWPLAYPDNTAAAILLRPLDPGFRLRDGGDRPPGAARPRRPPRPARRDPRAPRRCRGRTPTAPTGSGHGVRRIQLDGPFLFGGWWVQGRLHRHRRQLDHRQRRRARPSTTSVVQRAAHALLQGRRRAFRLDPARRPDRRGDPVHERRHRRPCDSERAPS